ncbi:restriction endonuclease [Streptomyces murinus]|uniref:restriction endonuclease n=1 Tax=Streptomyces murinus TaxID=33900 RepID=UPI00379F0B73
MIIDQDAAIAPPRFMDQDINEAQDRYLADADVDDMRAVYLWVTEGRLLLAMHKQVAKYSASVKTELDQAERRMRTFKQSTPTSFECTEVARKTAIKLRAEHFQAEKQRDQIAETWREMRNHFGMPAQIRELYLTGQDPEPSPLDEHIKLVRALPDAKDRIKQILADDRDLIHELAIREAEFIAFTKTDDSLSLDDIDAMDYAQFEFAVARLARRDGFTIERAGGGAGDLGADVIATCPDGTTRIVIQCKHGSRKTTVGSPAIQRLNGTARPVHKADHVVAVTNGSFSQPADKFARSQNIILIDRQLLGRWATWGTPLSEVLERTSHGKHHKAA